MRKYIIIFCILFSSLSYCQSEKRLLGDTATNYFRNYQELNRKLNNENLFTSTNEYHFRFWRYGLFVDLINNSSTGLSGYITNYIFKYQYDKQQDDYIIHDVIIERNTIDSLKKVQFSELINSSKLDNIPSDSEIQGWGFGKDGITYIFQTVKPEYISFKKYWEPNDQPDSLCQAKIIVNFMDEMNNLLNLEEFQSNFQNNLEPGRYSIGDQFMKIVR
jgi:hypothetical protein